MTYPRVKLLRYQLKTAKGFSFENPPPLKVSADAFDVQLADGVAIFTMKEHHASLKSAREQIEPVLQGWELEEALERDERAFWFDYVGGEIEDAPGKAVGSSLVSAQMRVSISVQATASTPPR